MDAIKKIRESTPTLGIKDKYLDQLHSDFQLLAEIVLSQLKIASTLVENDRDKDQVGELIRNEKIINSLDITIKEKVINAIILFTPRASDLRRLMSYHDMTISMERVGDLIENIAQAIDEMDLSLPGFEKYRKPISKMFEQTDKMLKSALFAFTGISNEMAYDTIQMDDKLDRMESKIEKQLATDFDGQVQNRQSLVNIMNLNSISYYLERIGDKAVDMAEAAVYLIEGKDIRHKTLPE